MFRKKTRGQVIGAELQEGFAHIGVAATEAGRLAAEQLGPRVAAAREAAGPTLDAAQKAAQEAVAPKVAAADGRRRPGGGIGPRGASPPAWRPPATPRPPGGGRPRRVGRGRRPRRGRAPAERRPGRGGPCRRRPRPPGRGGPEGARRLKDDVVPRLEAAQVAAAAYAAPRVAAARVAVAPALESARETLAAGVDSALSELDARRAELAATAEKSGRKARKSAKKARKTAAKKRHDFEVKPAATAKRSSGRPGSRRSPGAGRGVRRPRHRGGRRRPPSGEEEDSWTPAPAATVRCPATGRTPCPPPRARPARPSSDRGVRGRRRRPADSDLGKQTPVARVMARGDDGRGHPARRSGPRRARAIAA